MVHLVYILFWTSLFLSTIFSSQIVLQKHVPSVDYRSKVQVDLYVMSKCPDAVLCESVIAKSLEDVGDIVNLDLHFIGDLDSQEKKFGVRCMHGESECQGNIEELCAHKVAPKTWFQFVLCLNKDKSKIGDISFTSKCLSLTKIPVEPFNSCVRTQGKQLLQQSVQSAINVGIKTSCTILIDKGTHRCVHDGEWKDCPGGHKVEDFSRQICKAYKGAKKPAKCALFK